MYGCVCVHVCLFVNETKFPNELFACLNMRRALLWHICGHRNCSIFFVVFWLLLVIQLFRFVRLFASSVGLFSVVMVLKVERKRLREAESSDHWHQTAQKESQLLRNLPRSKISRTLWVRKCEVAGKGTGELGFIISPYFVVWLLKWLLTLWVWLLKWLLKWLLTRMGVAFALTGVAPRLLAAWVLLAAWLLTKSGILLAKFYPFFFIYMYLVTSNVSYMIHKNTELCCFWRICV